jgi:hypothetical protein
MTTAFVGGWLSNASRRLESRACVGRDAGVDEAASVVNRLSDPGTSAIGTKSSCRTDDAVERFVAQVLIASVARLNVTTA